MAKKTNRKGLKLRQNILAHFRTDSVSEAANILGLHRTTLYAWFREGKIGKHAKGWLIVQGLPVERWEK